MSNGASLCCRNSTYSKDFFSFSPLRPTEFLLNSTEEQIASDRIDYPFKRKIGSADRGPPSAEPHFAPRSLIEMTFKSRSYNQTSVIHSIQCFTRRFIYDGKAANCEKEKGERDLPVALMGLVSVLLSICFTNAGLTIWNVTTFFFWVSVDSRVPFSWL